MIMDLQYFHRCYFGCSFKDVGLLILKRDLSIIIMGIKKSILPCLHPPDTKFQHTPLIAVFVP